MRISQPHLHSVSLHYSFKVSTVAKQYKINKPDTDSIEWRRWRWWWWELNDKTHILYSMMSERVIAETKQNKTAWNFHSHSIFNIDRRFLLYGLRSVLYCTTFYFMILTCPMLWSNQKKFPRKANESPAAFDFDFNSSSFRSLWIVLKLERPTYTEWDVRFLYFFF